MFQNQITIGTQSDRLAHQQACGYIYFNHVNWPKVPKISVHYCPVLLMNTCIPFDYKGNLATFLLAFNKDLVNE